MADIVKHGAQLPVSTMVDLQNMGAVIAASGMIGISDANSGMVVAMTCHLEGISPIEFGRVYDIVKGKPSKKTAAMAKDYRAIGGRYKLLERTATRAAAEFTFEGEVTVWEFTLEQAKRAGLAGGSNVNWNHYPENMLWARMMSNALNVICPEVKYGIYTPEEVSDFDDTPQQSVPVPIDPAEVAKRVEAVVMDEVTVDYNRCPIELDNGNGGLHPANTFTWDQFTSDYLQAMLANLNGNPILTEMHLAKINELIIAS